MWVATSTVLCLFRFSCIFFCWNGFSSCWWHCASLKLVSTIFYQIFISHQMIALQKLRQMLFISLKKLFSFSRYSNFYISIFPSFSLWQPLFRGWSKINLKVYDVINWQYTNLITHFVWYLKKEKRYDIETLSIDRVLNKEHFY